MYILWEFYEHEGWEPVEFENELEMLNYINRSNKPSNLTQYIKTQTLYSGYHDVEEFYED